MASDLGLHCLHMPFLWDARLKWVKTVCRRRLNHLNQICPRLVLCGYPTISGYSGYQKDVVDDYFSCITSFIFSQANIDCTYAQADLSSLGVHVIYAYINCFSYVGVQYLTY